MLPVIDTGTSQWNLDFVRAFGEGFHNCYVKMGGDNVETYVAPWYTRQVDRARAAGFEHVGHYWVPDANPADSDPIDTPTQQADYMADRLHDWRKLTDFIVLDNEALDGAWMFTDAGAAEFIERIKSRLGIPGRQVVMYGGWYDLAAHTWPLVLATGAMFIVADYRASSQPGFSFPDIPTIPRPRIIGHQTGGRAIGGVVTDTNVFVDHAFDYGGTMPLSNYTLRSPSTVILADNRDPFVSWQNHVARGSGGVDIVAPVGTPVYARTAGTMIHVPNNGNAGNSSQFKHDSNPGWRDVFSHLSAYVGASGRHFEAGEVVAYTGDTGGVAPHLHWHLLDPSGARQNPWNYFSGGSTAGGSGTPIEEDELNDEQNNALMSVYKAVFFGGGDAGEAIITRLNKLEGRLVNVDRQVTGADGFDPSVAGRVIDIQANVSTGGVDVAALAAQIIAGLPAGSQSPSAAEIAEEIARRLAS